MTYSDFTQKEYFTTLQSDFSSELPSTHGLWYWLNYKFANYTFLYQEYNSNTTTSTSDSSTTTTDDSVDYIVYRHMKATIMECQMEIKKITFLTNLELSAFGTTTTSSNTSSQDSSGTNTMSYAGYNVEGDFNKQTSSGTATGTGSGSVFTMDNYQLIEQELTKLYDRLFAKFASLFVLISC